MQGKEVINGLEGKVWLDGEVCANIISCKGEITFDMTDVTIAGDMMKHKKWTGSTSSGEVKFHKINSTIMKKLHECYSNHKMPLFTIISKLNDPDNGGTERVVFHNCIFEKMVLADWETGKLTEESYPFSFTSYEILDSI